MNLPRDLSGAIPGVNLVEMSSNRRKPIACGSVLTLLKEPGVAADIGKIRLDEAVRQAPKSPCSLPVLPVPVKVSADARNIPIEVVDLASFASSALGYDPAGSES